MRTDARLCLESAPKLDIIIPVKDEEGRIEHVLREVHSVLLRDLQISHQLIIVDDGSKDQTFAGLKGLASSFQCVTPMRLSHNHGKGHALNEGLKQSRADLILLMDGDGQHDPVDIPRIIRPLLVGEADVVLGSRLTKGRPETMPLRHYLAILIATRLFNTRMDTSFKDILCGFRAFMAVRTGSPVSVANGYGLEVSTLRACVTRSLIIREVPCSSIYDKTASFVHGLQVMSQVILEIARG